MAFNNLAYLGAGIAAVVLGYLLMRFISARGARADQVVSLPLGYSAIFAILTLWAFGLISIGAGVGWNNQMLGL